MAVEAKKILFLPSFFRVDEDNKPKPNNYKPLFTIQILPGLSCTNIEIPKLSVSGNNKNPNNYSIEFEELNPSGMDEESGIRVVRSVVAGFLIRRFEEREVFTPVTTDSIIYDLKEEGLLAPFEKRAMVEVGQDDEDENEVLISALNSALISIEADTDAIKCLNLDNLNGIYKERVCVMSILRENLVDELLPVSLHLEDLALSPEELFPNLEELEARELKRLRALCDEDY